MKELAPDPLSFDPSPLNWVKGEIDLALERAHAALEEFRKTQNRTQFKFCRTHLHQVHGALAIINLQGLTLLTEAQENLLDELDNGVHPPEPERLDVLDQTIIAIGIYLDDLLAGMPNQPLRLLPQLQALAQARGKPRMSPGALFFPDLTWEPQHSSNEVENLRAVLHGEERASCIKHERNTFQLGLLAWLRHPHPSHEAEAGRQKMLSALVAVEALQETGLQQAFWRVARAFVEALALPMLFNDPDARQLCSTLDLQLRRSQDAPGQIAERVLREALYFLAIIPQGSSELCDEIRTAYQLAALLPEPSSPRDMAMRRLREAVALGDELWYRYSAGNASALPAFAEHIQHLIRLTLNTEPKIIGELIRAIYASAAQLLAPLQTNDAEANRNMGREIATALRVLLYTQTHHGDLPDEYLHTLDLMVTRLQLSREGHVTPAPDSPPLLAALAAAAGTRLHVGQVARDVQGHLLQVEQVLDNYFRQPKHTPSLEELRQPLEQIIVALSTIDQPDAAAYLQKTMHHILGLQDGVVNPNGFEAIANDISTLGFYIDALQHGPKDFSDFLQQLQGLHHGRPPVQSHAEQGLAQLLRSQHKQTLALVSDLLEQRDSLSNEAEVLSSLSAALRTLHEDADLAGNHGLKEQAYGALQVLQQAHVDIAHQLLAIATLLGLPLPASTPPPSVAKTLEEAMPPAPPPTPEIIVSTTAVVPSKPESEAAIDRDLLAIFLEEAAEVLSKLQNSLNELRAAPLNREVLTSIRRNVHTLKGSGRMVGLQDLGEVAWEVEQTLNLWLRQDIAVEAQLLELISLSHRLFSAWLTHLHRPEQPLPETASVLHLADKLRQRVQDPLPALLPSQPAESSAAENEQVAAPIVAIPAPVVEVLDLDLGAAEIESAVEPIAPSTPTPPTPPRQVLKISPALFDVFRSEAMGHLASLQRGIEELRVKPQQLASFDMSRAAHTLAGIAGTVGLVSVSQLVHAFDAALQRRSSAGNPVDPVAIACFTEVLSALSHVLPTLKQGEQPVLPADLEPRLDALYANYAYPPVPKKLPALTPLAEALANLNTPNAANNVVPIRPDLVLPVVAVATSVPASSSEGESTDGDMEADADDIPVLEVPAPTEVLIAQPAQPLTNNIDTSIDTSTTVGTNTVLSSLSTSQPSSFLSASDFAELTELTIPEIEPLPSAELPAVQGLEDLFQDFDLRQEPTLSAEPLLSTANDDDALFYSNLFAVVTPVPNTPNHEQAEQEKTVRVSLPVPEVEELVELVVEPLDTTPPPITPEHAEVAEQASLDLEQPDSREQPQPDEPEAAAITVTGITEQEPVAELETLDFALDVPLDDLPLPDIEEMGAVVSEPSNPEEAAALAQLQTHQGDVLEPEVFAIFLEEADDLVSGFSLRLNEWRSQPENRDAGHGLARLLHTFKGGARMAGASQLGEQTHALEAEVEALCQKTEIGREDIDALQANCDGLVATLNSLRHQQQQQSSTGGVAALAESALLEPQAAIGDAPVLQTVASLDEKYELGASRPSLRVSTELVDKMTNEAGEMAITLNRIQSEMNLLDVSLHDLSDNVSRLHQQLREIEIQAEAQLQARRDQGFDEFFDPLELDRFTRFQELTRIISESVNDVATVQQTLLHNVAEANTAIAAQSRLHRGLQDDLMGVRLLPFESAEDRLQRTLRQACKDTGKQARLFIQGGQIELDRAVLDQILPPLEHMLRNAVSHGIESPKQRLAQGKSEMGEVRILLSRQGGEIKLVVSDDGAGLNLERIWARAHSLGLLQPGDGVASPKLLDCIFLPGFSTATEVTAAAGRGIGMDVVKSALDVLGGQIDVETRSGVGSSFIIHLPLTMAIMQAVICRVGGQLYAIPSSMIAQVQELKFEELAAIRSAGQVTWLGKNYPFHFLPNLLGDSLGEPDIRPYYWVVLLRGGAQRVAVQVEEVKGQQDVVVKDVGPQLARVVGIDGATILGDGQVVLIINPIALAQRAAQTQAQFSPFAPLSQPTETASDLVMVVDDSLTVRKITTRLLEKAGYRVLAARDGVEALDMLQQEAPLAMLCDIDMPRMDGFDLLRQVRGDERYANLPVIIVTSRTADKHREHAFALGATAYLGKPYAEEDLLALLASYQLPDSVAVEAETETSTETTAIMDQANPAISFPTLSMPDEFEG